MLRSRPLQPFHIGLKFQAEFVIVDPQVAVAAAYDRTRDDSLHLLRQDAYIGRVPAVVDEFVKTYAVVETIDQRDVVLKSDIRSPPTTAAHSTTAAQIGRASCRERV